jgi:hypothetical protein
MLEVGDSLDIRLLAIKLDGSAVPMASGTFAVVDLQGQPSALASIDSQGHLVALDAGSARVVASVTGANVAAQYVELTIYPSVIVGRRLVVIDAATRAPIAGATVSGCASIGCVNPEIVATDTTGAATFAPFATGAADFTVIAPQLRPADGVPAYERITAIATAATSLLIPLRPNPVHSASGINATVTFNQVHSNGTYWTGFSAVSIPDPLRFSPATLLGDNFWTELPAISQRVPIPASVTLYTSIGFGIGQEVKPRSLSLGEPGNRRAIAFAGRASQAQALNLRSLDLLSYLGAFDFDVAPHMTLSAAATVPDSADVDADGLCTDSARCPMGSEDVPDYARFTALAFAPKREQLLRTEVQVPPLPAPFDRVVVTAIALENDTGILPLGLTSKVATNNSSSGRTVDPFVLRSGTPYGDLALAAPGLFAIAQSADGEAQTGRLALATALPTLALLKPFLPALQAPTYSSVDRKLRPHQPEWAAAYSAGGNWARLTLRGSQTTHCYYFPHVGQAAEVALPPTPLGTSLDPSDEQNSSATLSAIDLTDGLTADEVLSFRGINLLNLAQAIDGYSSFER